MTFDGLTPRQRSSTFTVTASCFAGAGSSSWALDLADTDTL